MYPASVRRAPTSAVPRHLSRLRVERATASDSGPARRGSDGRLLLRRQPATDLSVKRGRADDRSVDPPRRGVEDERVRLRTTEPAVRADLLLEGRDLAGGGVEHADDDEVAALGHAIDPAEPRRRVRAVARDRVIAVDAALGEMADAGLAEDDRPARGGADQYETDSLMSHQSVDEARIGRVDLLPAGAAGQVRERDVREVARSGDDDVR